ncbi:MAG: STAS domain-containing protein [Lachnospiraceae bacterium]|nr:STAS domain-containing protein [Lachnospiraceae bacterium]
MTINVNKDGEKLVLSPEGRIDTVTAPEFSKAIDDNISGVKDLTIDFEKLEYISSAGLRVLLTTQKSMSKVGSMKLIHVSDVIMDVFNITGFVDILTIE